MEQHKTQRTTGQERRTKRLAWRAGLEVKKSLSLPVEGELFSLTFPFIDQAIALKTPCHFSNSKYSRSTQIVCSQGCLPVTWPTSILARGNGTPSKDSTAAITNDCPKHFSNNVRVWSSSSSRTFGGIPMSFAMSPAFMSVF